MEYNLFILPLECMDVCTMILFLTELKKKELNKAKNKQLFEGSPPFVLNLSRYMSDLN